MICERLCHHIAFCEVSKNAVIGPGFTIFSPRLCIVGMGVRAGKNLTISHNVIIGGNVGKQRQDGSGYPILGNNLYVGKGASIFGPVEIGDNTVIGVGAKVTYDVPPNSIVAPIESRIVRRNGERIPLTDGPTELSRILRDLSSRVVALEAKTAGHNEHQSVSPPSSR